MEPLEFRIIKRNAHVGKGLAVFTSGGDSQGMNAAVRSVVRMSIFLGCTTYFIKEGYQGMIDGGDNIVHADWPSVSCIIHKGGTVIGSARCKGFYEREGRLKAAKNLIDRGITNLVIIGGDGSLTGANLFRIEWISLLDELLQAGKITTQQRQKYNFLQIAGLVASIDNDFCGTDMTIGTDSALHRITEAIDAIASTAYSHQRTFILEVMGRHCGYLALVSSLASEADYVFIPELPESPSWPKKLCTKLSQSRSAGQRLNIVIIAEGAVDTDGKVITANEVRDIILNQLKHDCRVTVLGHIQRGGHPSAFDRILGCRMGAEAVISLMEATQDTEPCIIAFNGCDVVKLPLKESVRLTQELTQAMKNKDYEKAVQLRGMVFMRNLKTYQNLMLPVNSSTKLADLGIALGVMCVGAPACGMNAAIWSFVRNSIYKGYTPFGIHDGFEGFYTKHIQKLEWSTVTGWVAQGGANLGVKRTLPTACKMSTIAKTLEEFKIKGLLIIGGFEAFQGGLMLTEFQEKYPPLKIPIVIIPSTISNNVPGTMFSLGSDTALNEITQICDRIRQSGQSTKRRVFVVETMGRFCGYLATLAGLASGADASYIHEEPFSIKELQQDVTHLCSKMAEGVPRGLILRNECASDNYNTDFITRMLTEEGKGQFSVKMNILGHLQQGGYPTPFDRSTGISMAYKCVEWLGNCVQKNKYESTLLGIHYRRYKFTSLEELKQNANFELKRPKKDIWWMELRPLLKIMGHCYHIDNYAHYEKVQIPATSVTAF